MSVSSFRSDDLIHRQDSQLLIVDMQEKLLPAFPEKVRPQLITNCQLLIEMAKLFEVPISATEQYPQGLGRTIPELGLDDIEIPAKTDFSSWPALNWPAPYDEESTRPRIIVAGIESHVCVMQTVLDLIAQGYKVYIPVDAVASRFKLDWKIAIERLALSGAILTTTESVLFEWCERAGTPEFKQLSQRLKAKTKPE
ncbi:Isochorismatase family protein [Polystyrenella longa]|uniref:Isochorismatase family protein n=1 Tax=Polystyrenella longa TaxID=2528007 RepID=A0A518CSA8_9PLAN|nr:hydrolase [Polystyrenella longa]QDU82103.1 Isochorismatase family protein [Polystyrenella longa]